MAYDPPRPSGQYLRSAARPAPGRRDALCEEPAADKQKKDERGRDQQSDNTASAEQRLLRRIGEGQGWPAAVDIIFQNAL